MESPSKDPDRPTAREQQLLAATAAADLELAALTRARDDDRALLELTVAVAELGTFDLDLASGELQLNQRLLELSALTRETFAGSPEHVYAHIHPDDRDTTVAAVERAVATGTDYAADYRILDPAGVTRWIAARGTVRAGPGGTPGRLRGVALDVSEMRDAATRTEQILDSMAVGYLAMDVHWRITYANAEAVRALGHPRERLLGAVVWELFPATVGTVFEENYRRAADTGRAVSFDAYYPAPLDAWYEIRATPEPDGVALYFTDITTRQRAYASRDLAARRLDGIARFTLSLGRARSIDDLVRVVAEVGLGELGCNGGSVATADPADEQYLLSYLTSSYGRAAQVTYGRLPRSADLPVAAAARRGRAVLVADRAACLAWSPAMADVLEVTGSQAFASVPLDIGGHVIGVVTAGWAEPQPFDDDQLSLLDTFAAQVAQALQRLQALEAERAAARRVAGMSEALQRSLLAELPQPDHLQLVARYVPAADEAQVGGDWYDAFLVRDGATCVAIGDVTGHDQGAAVQMAQVRNVLRGVAHAVEQPPAAILDALDRAMRDLAVGALATAVLAKIEQTPEDTAAGRRVLRWSNAGHLPPLLLHPDGRAELLERACDPLLGVGGGGERTDHTQVLHPGATVLLFTDGLVERRDEDLDTGLRRLAGTAEQLAHLPLDELCDELLARLGGGVEDDVEDDIALLAIRAHPQDRARPPEAGPAALPEDLTAASPAYPGYPGRPV